MADLAVPLIAATVFTLGGYAILRAERYASAIGGVLGFFFLITAMTALLALLARVAERNGPRDTGQAFTTHMMERAVARPSN